MSHTGTVRDISDEHLLNRAVIGARLSQKAPRWVVVSEVLGLGSTYATQLCTRFGLDPDEVVKPWPRRAR